eukprot:GCRY01003795.1.p1 GENE.GCRY01003795.1~~GCRY01003795.1.p1  ORF type:complete len:329 (+),score=51.05 GCRY01003795.1:151-1137(+)
MDAQNLQNILQQAFVPNTDCVRKATEELERLVVLPECIPAFFTVAIEAEPDHIRNLAALFLANHCQNFWKLLDPSVKNIIQTKLLDRLAIETNESTQNSFCLFVAKILRMEMTSNGNWAALFGFLQQHLQSAQPAPRVLALKLFTILCENCMKTVRPMLADVLTVVSKALEDSEPTVQVAGMELAASILPSLNNKQERKIGASLILATLHALSQYASAPTVHLLHSALVALNTMVSEAGPCCSRAVLTDTLCNCLQIGTAQSIDLDWETRALAFSCISFVLPKKDAAVILSRTQELRHSLLTTCFSLVKDEEGMDDEDEGEGEGEGGE